MSLFDDRATVPALTLEDVDAMQRHPGFVKVEHGKAALWLQHGRWIMHGPSGWHRIWEQATDLERLNAHWQTFASHALNRPEGA